MSAAVIDGKAFALSLRARVAAEAERFRAEAGRPAALHVVLVGDEGPSAVYVRAKEKATAEAGMRGAVHRLPAEVTQADLLELVEALSADDEVDGILVQLPLPPHIDERAVIVAIDPATGEISRTVPVTATSGCACSQILTGMSIAARATSAPATAKTASRSASREISTTICPASTTCPGSAPVAVTTPSFGATSWV